MLVLCAACEARVGTSAGSVDASTSAGDDAPDDPIGTDAPACFNGRVVFLSFEGESLTRALVSDAKTNRASWMEIGSGTAPPYKAGVQNRAVEIQAIIDGVRAQLSSFPITVVTTRPLTGDYVMIVYGGQPGQVGSEFGGAVQELDCGDAVRNDVAWISDNVGSVQRIVNFSVGAIGFGLGLTATLDPTDCMCGWDNNCTSDNNQACTLTPGIARDPNARQRCNGVTTQDEVATFAEGFCQ